MSELPRVDITSQLIDRMINDSRFTTVFPFLKQAVRTRRTKGCCGRPAQTITSVDYGWVKKNFAVGTTNNQKLKLKRLLQARQVRVTYRSDSGKIIVLKF